MASAKLTLLLSVTCAVVTFAPFPYVVTRSARDRERTCMLMNSLYSNDSSNIRINYQIFKVASKTPSHVQIVQLFSKTGYFLEVTNEKRISGTVNGSKESTFFESQSLGTSIVRLRNLVSGRYLAINSKGRITAQAKISEDSLFKTMYEENYFHSFSSHKYFKEKRHDLFIGIKQNGRSKPPKQTSAGQIAVQFMLLEKRNNTEEKVRVIASAKQSRLMEQEKRDIG